MQKRGLGTNGPRVSAVGLGCMGMSGVYGSADDDESVATIHAALDAGVTVLDTGDFYGMGHNELLVGRALKGRHREDAVISVKFGMLGRPGGGWGGFDGRPAAVRNFVAYSLNRLGVDYIDIYRPARLDPAVPVEETIGAISELVDAGYIRHIGLSEVGVETIRRAQAVHPIVDLQIEYSLLSRAIEDEILPTCRELGIGITAYGVLSRGLLSGQYSAGSSGDFRAHSPRFQGENLDHNLRLVDELRVVAQAKEATVAQIAIAWALHRGDDIVPVIGTRRRIRLAESLAALDISLDANDLERIEKAIPAGAAAGDRYPTASMAMLDSEK
ncbi:aldo/keto reductase [Fodinicola feengrottensis]|uniref:Aldo/keto reductase n=1 Tax=Fodinicola feengrottensis TaxID=435914 RepID=A0ABN2J1U1_9ACTN